MSLLHNFIQLNLNSGSAQVQTLLAACQRFAMVRISVPAANKAKRLSSVNHTTKTIVHHHYHHHHHHHHHHHQKANYNIKISELEKKLTDHNHDKYITAPEFHTSAADVLNARLAQANLITKTDFDAKLSSLNGKITSNKTKLLLVEDKLNKLKTFDSSYFICRNHFE